MLQEEVGHCEASHVDAPPPAPPDELLPPAPPDELLPPVALEDVPPTLVVPPAPTSAPPEPGLSTVASLAISMPASPLDALDRSVDSS